VGSPQGTRRLLFETIWVYRANPGRDQSDLDSNYHYWRHPWLIASKIMRTDAQQGIFLNIVVGIVGAMLAGFLLSPLLGISSINAGDFSIGALLISLLGAVILLAIVNFFRRGRAR